MTKTQKKVISFVASAALLVNTALPVFAQTIEVTGNGADSNNTAHVDSSSTTTVGQTNAANISNNVSVSSSTGANDANKNTNGNVQVQTGDATTVTKVSNTANSNVADVKGCCATDANVVIGGNGADSQNKANLDLSSTTTVNQTNAADLQNNVDAKSSTGKNDANKNTGGTVDVQTGDATTKVVIDNTANQNLAKVGGDSSTGGSVTLKIWGNGADSKNDIKLDLDRSLTLLQTNAADVQNNVEAKADTGYNKANENTGGDVSVSTGDATTGVGITNTANFNAASLDCGCLLDVLAKIADNGADSHNKIKAELDSTQSLWQTNAFECTEKGLDPVWYESHGCNNVDAKSKTGGNDAKENTGVTSGDPTSVQTGDAGSLVQLDTTANSNVIGSMPSWPDMPQFQFNFDTSNFNHGFFWAWLSGLMG